MTTFQQPGSDYIGVGVGAVIFNDEGKILLQKRGPQAKNERGTWEIPGGSVEFGEMLAAAIIREVREELGVEVTVEKLLEVNDHILPEEGQHWISPSFICRIISGTPAIQEPGKTDEIGWFTLEEAAQLPLAKVTQRDVEQLQKRILK